MIDLQFKASSEDWVQGLCANDSATIKILGIKLDDLEQNIIHFVDITSTETIAEDLKKELQASYDVLESDVASLGTTRVVGSVRSSGCKVGSVIMSYGSKRNGGFFVGMSTTGSDCKMNYKLTIKGELIPEFLQALHEEGVSFMISEISKWGGGRKLNLKQSFLLKSALELGYYDYPKRISTEALLEKVGLSASTFTESLRRVDEKIIQD
jgi:hypothetical protein